VEHLCRPADRRVLLIEPCNAIPVHRMVSHAIRGASAAKAKNEET